ECHLRTLQTLQPGKRRVLRVAQEHPALTILHADQPIDKRQHVCLFDRYAAEFRCGDVHIPLANDAGTWYPPQLEASTAQSYVLATKVIGAPLHAESTKPHSSTRVTEPMRCDFSH